MLRWTFRIAADLSLVLCLTGIVFGVRGYFFNDSAEWRNSWQVARTNGRFDYHSRQTVLWSSIGEFRFNAQRDSIIGWPVKNAGQALGAQLFLRANAPYWVPPSRQAKYLINRWGFSLGEINQSGPWGWVHGWMIGVPAWAWVLFFGLLPGIRGILWRRPKGQRKGMYCEECGYDLRESKERCPECGMAVETVGQN